MSKLERAKQYVKDPLRPLRDRVQSAESLLQTPTTLFLCQSSNDKQAQIFLSTSPFNFVHARINCVISPEILKIIEEDGVVDDQYLTVIEIKAIEIINGSWLWAKLYRDYGASKCSMTNDTEKIQQPFSRLHNLIQTAKFLPIALIFGQWDRVE